LSPFLRDFPSSASLFALSDSRRQPDGTLDVRSKLCSRRTKVLSLEPLLRFHKLFVPPYRSSRVWTFSFPFRRVPLFFLRRCRFPQRLIESARAFPTSHCLVREPRALFFFSPECSGPFFLPIFLFPCPRLSIGSDEAAAPRRFSSLISGHFPKIQPPRFLQAFLLDFLSRSTLSYFLPALAP